MIKEKSQTWAQISRNLGALFSRFPLTPDCYTWLTIPFALIGLLLIVYNFIWLGVIFYLIAGILDLVDGALARHLNRATSRGAFLDGSLDRFIDFIVIFSYFWLPITMPWMPLGQWLCMAIFFAIMPSFEVAYANHRQAVTDPEEKIIWRILNRGEMYFLMLLIPVFSVYSSVWAGYLLIALVVLSLITTLQTLWTTLSIAAKTEKSID
jgi:archaetidylinositol phosphate synthase